MANGDGWFGATAARVALRALGTSKVMLKMCGGGTAVAVEGIGLEAPAMQEIELGPVLVRNATDGAREVLVEASMLETAVGEKGEAVRSVLMSSARMEVGDVEMRIADVSAEYLGGAAYLYRISVEA